MEKRKRSTKSKPARQGHKPDADEVNSPYDADEMEFLRLVGRQIAAARVRKSLTQQKLADGISLSRGYIGLLEQGKRNPHVLALRRIAGFLQVQVCELVDVHEM